jgi:hypothetical protein
MDEVEARKRLDEIEAMLPTEITFPRAAIGRPFVVNSKGEFVWYADEPAIEQMAGED